MSSKSPLNAVIPPLSVEARLGCSQRALEIDKDEKIKGDRENEGKERERERERG